MKKLFITSLLILLMGMGTTAKAEINDSIDIPITTGDSNNHSNKPKAPDRVPVLCMYEDGVLYFGFNYDLGAVTITVTNENTNQQWLAFLQTSSNYNTMNISEDSGCYHIEITTLSNIVYYGNFEINY